MENKSSKDRQLMSIIILFLIGESSIFIEGVAAKKDLWISIILTVILTIPLVLIITRLQTLYPHKTLFEIIENICGKIIGKFLVLLYTWFALDLLVIAYADFGYFINTVAFPETPKVIPVFFYSLVCVYAVKLGIKILGMWAQLFLLIPIIFQLSASLLLIPQMDFNNVQPVLYYGVEPVLNGVLLTYSFPFGYLIGLPLAFGSFTTKKSYRSIYFKGYAIGSFIIFLTSMTAVLVLGEYACEVFDYPTYNAVSRIGIAQFIKRPEMISTIIYLIGGFIGLTIWLMASCQGLNKLFNTKDHKLYAIPLALLAVTMAEFDFNSVNEYFHWSRTAWKYYVFPFEAIIPIILWIIAEIKNKKDKKRLEGDVL